MGEWSLNPEYMLRRLNTHIGGFFEGVEAKLCVDLEYLERPDRRAVWGFVCVCVCMCVCGLAQGSEEGIEEDLEHRNRPAQLSFQSLLKGEEVVVHLPEPKARVNGVQSEFQK